MELAKEHPDVKIVGLRYCNVYGPRENHKGHMANMTYRLAQQMLIGRPRIFKDGEQKRDQIYVKDLFRANLNAIQAKQSCVVNCGTGKPISFNEMISVLNKVLEMNKEPEYIDNPNPEYYQTHIECNMNKAKKMIGFIPKFSCRERVEDYYKRGWLTKPTIQ